MSRRYGDLVMYKNITKQTIITIIMDEKVKEYEQFVASCFNENPTNNKVLDFVHMTMALMSESGEFADIVKKAVFHSKETSKVDLIDELGDVLFYFMNICHFLDITLDDVMEANLIKIRERYPDGRGKNYNFGTRNKIEEKKRIEQFLMKIKQDVSIDISINNPNHHIR